MSPAPSKRSPSPRVRGMSPGSCCAVTVTASYAALTRCAVICFAEHMRGCAIALPDHPVPGLSAMHTLAWDVAAPGMCAQEGREQVERDRQHLRAGQRPTPFNRTRYARQPRRIRRDAERRQVRRWVTRTIPGRDDCAEVVSCPPQSRFDPRLEFGCGRLCSTGASSTYQHDVIFFSADLLSKSPR